jgi:uncharacterized membrane protein
VPKSRVRKKKSTPQEAEWQSQERKAVKIGPKPWIAPLMIGLFIFGLAWIVVFYITRGDVAGMRALGNWNLLVGFGFIAAGFIVSTRWR